MENEKNIKITAALAKAAFQVDFSEAPDDIEYMPEGVHQVCCSKNGKPVEMTLAVDETLADVFQKSLDAVFAKFDAGEMSKPFIDFDHKGGEAAAFPRRFFWKDGLRLEVEWTEAGRRAVENKTYNYFSPEFFIGEDGVIKGVAAPGAIGALVNVPAFQRIQKLTAKSTEGKIMSEEDKTKQTPPPANGEEGNKNTPPAQTPPPPANGGEKKPTVEELQAQLDAKNKECEAAKAALEDAKKSADGEKEKAECARKTAIESRVDGLVKAGRLAATGKAAIVASALASADNGEAIFSALPERAQAGFAPLPNNGAGIAAGVEPLEGVDRAAAAFNRAVKK